jgi:ATP-dependent DNA helicase RecG
MLPQAELDDILRRVGTDGPGSSFESELLEFKRADGASRDVYDRVADAAVCLANARGGSIVLGVDDKAASRTGAVLGVKPEMTPDVVRKAIYDRTQPHMIVMARDVQVDEIRLIVLDVPQGLEPCANQKGLATRRLGTECLPFTPDQQRELLVARGYFDWSSEGSDVVPSSVSEVEVDRIRGLIRLAGNDELAALPTRKLIEALRLVHESGTLANAGVLLLCDEATIARAIPAHGYAYQHRPTPGTEATARFRRTRPIVVAAQELIEAVTQRTTIRPLALAGGVQLQLADYPERAVREIIVNALLHRSYHAAGTVDLTHSPESLIVTSPGGLVAGVTPSNILTHPSTPRNRLLADVVSRLQLAERTGQGVDRAYREMLRFGKEPPGFEDSGLAVTAVLRGGIGNDAFVRYLDDLPVELSSDVDVLLALSALRSRTSISAVEFAPVVQRSIVEAHDVLTRLADDRIGILEPTRRTAASQFPAFRLRPDPLASLARAVTYRRRTMDQIDGKIIDHVGEYGFVTNRTIQRMLDVHVFAARNILSDMRTRGILEKLGDARGGPGVRYGPGSTFPRDTRMSDARLIAGESGEQPELF